MSVADYNTDPNSNTSISGINIAEGCPPSGINNALRQMMADIKTADDNDVKLSGAQTVGGAKTFTSHITMSGSGANTIKRTEDNDAIYVCGATSILNGAVLAVFGKGSANAGFFSLRANNGDYYKDLIGKPDGALTWDGKGFVYDSGNQTIAGAKTFSSNVTVTKDLAMKNASLASRGTTPSASQWWTASFTADNGNEVSGLWHNISTSNDSITEIRCYRNNATADTARFWAQVKADGTKETGIDASIFRPAVSSYPSLGGSGAYRWSHVYATDTTITTSDERKKTAIADIPDAVLDAWGDVAWQQFQMRDAVAKKGENARIHNGLVAQRIDAAFKARGLDASRYGLFCYDEWGATEAQCNEKGEILEPATEAGNEYSLRYEEALCMEAAYQRRRADRAEARLASIEERLAVLEARI